MQHKKYKKRVTRLLAAVFAAVMAVPLIPMTASARESGNTVLLEDYYGLTDSNAIKVPGLTYYCSGHGDKMIEYYVEEENDYMREIPGIITRMGNKIRYVKAYYCQSCFAQWKDGPVEGRDGSNFTREQTGAYGSTLDDYFDTLANGSTAALAGYGYYYPPKDDFAHIPYPKDAAGNWITVGASLGQGITDELILAGKTHSNKALPEPVFKQPDSDDPIGNWDVIGAWTFYQFYYTGMRQVINRPASANDPAWDTVRDMTRIYYMKRQQEGQLAGPRINYSTHWYSYDYSMLGDWVVTDLMAEYKTGEICGYVSYVGQGTEIAVPETVTIPLYGEVKVIGVDIEDHNLTKVYINDNVTCIRRLSSVNLEEISGCKNLEYIEKYAFQNDVSLKTIPEMPKLDWIAMGAFEGCISLRDIKLPDNMTFIDFTAFGWYDTVLGNYDIGMDVESWEAFQYLRDLSDNDKILGITLYAKKDSTTYMLLDTLINKNDALTPALDDDGNPYFQSYGETVAMISGEVKNYTGHWNLKSSGEYKGNIASTDKDVDDSTGGRLGEYGNDEPSYSPRKILEEGALVAGLLAFFGITSGVSQYRKKDEEIIDREGKPDDADDEYWGIAEVYDDLDAADKTKLYFDILDAFSDKIEKCGKLGKAGAALIKMGKAAQKACDIYAETGNWIEALKQARATSLGVGEGVGFITDAVPAIGTWDMISSIVLGNSKAADAVNFGGNVEHLADLYYDMARAAENQIIPGFNKGAYTTEEIYSRIMDGSYGENLQNLSAVADMVRHPESAGQIWNGIFGEDGMGFDEFMNGVCNTATEKTTDHSLVSGYLLEWFNNSVEKYYETH